MSTEDNDTPNSDLFDQFADTENLENGVKKALDILFQYSQIDGGHHKAWSIDKIAQALTGSNYEDFVRHYEYVDYDASVAKAKAQAVDDEYDVMDYEEYLEPDYSWDAGTGP